MKFKNLVAISIISAVIIILSGCQEEREPTEMEKYAEWSACITRVSEIESQLSECMFGADALTKLKVEQDLDEALCRLASVQPPPYLKRRHYAILKLGVLTLAIMQLNRRGHRMAVVGNIVLMSKWLEDEKVKSQPDIFEILKEVQKKK